MDFRSRQFRPHEIGGRGLDEGKDIPLDARAPEFPLDFAHGIVIVVNCCGVLRWTQQVFSRCGDFPTKGLKVACLG